MKEKTSVQAIWITDSNHTPQTGT